MLASWTYTSASGQVSKRPDGGNSIQHALKALHFYTTEIWAGRNEVLHGQTQQDIMLQHNLVDAAITRYHNEPDLLLNADSHYCTQSLARLLRSSSSTKRRWLHRVKISRQKKESATARQPRITKHFKISDASTKQEGHPPALTRQAPVQRISSARNTTVQRLMTFFFRERAPSQTSSIVQPSPPPSQHRSD